MNGSEQAIVNELKFLRVQLAAVESLLRSFFELSRCQSETREVIQQLFEIADSGLLKSESEGDSPLVPALLQEAIDRLRPTWLEADLGTNGDS